MSDKTINVIVFAGNKNIFSEGVYEVFRNDSARISYYEGINSILDHTHGKNYLYVPNPVIAKGYNSPEILFLYGWDWNFKNAKLELIIPYLHMGSTFSGGKNIDAKTWHYLYNIEKDFLQRSKSRLPFYDDLIYRFKLIDMD
jgi:hypothetical protein